MTLGRFREPGTRLPYVNLRWFGSLGNASQMPHFSARSGFDLAVKVKFKVRGAKSARPVWFTGFPKFAEQIGNGGGAVKISRAERQPAHRAKLLLELRRH